MRSIRFTPRLVGPLVMAAILASPAAGQDVRPGDERPELPDFEAPYPGRDALLEVAPLPEVPAFEPPVRTRGGVLPSLPLSEEPDTEGLAAGARLVLRGVRIRGNIALPAETLDAVARAYLGRELGFEDLEALRDELTQAYLDRGFVTSGSVIPTQTLEDGVLEIWIVEGRVTGIDVQSDGRLREAYVRGRVAHGVGPPVNVGELEQTLQRLQQDPRIRSVDARLVPAERRGEAILRVRVTEATPWRVRLSGNNYSSPAIGGGRGELRASWNNVTGFGDELFAEYKGGEGLQDVRARWSAPLTSRDTGLDLHFRRTWSEVVEAPFDVFDIRSETETYGFRLSQPVHRTEHVRVETSLTGEWRRAESFLFGDPFSFVQGPDDGVSTLAVLRFGGDAAWRTRDQVLAARLLVSVGLPVLGATENDAAGVPDANFVAWLAQLQWARRFPDLWGLQVVARADAQLADRPLFGLEQFAVGGHGTVRGYRENRLVRDNGLVGSVELRLPVPLPGWGEWRPRFDIAPFLDAGYSWNTDRDEIGPTTLFSVGVGGRLELTEHLRLEAYWGHDLRDLVDVGTDSLQSDGVHLGIQWEMP
jgi:hemolysin activation/secretion protein